MAIVDRHPDLVEWERRVHPLHTLMGGTYAMREAGTLYLPREPGEQYTAYLNRLQRSVLFNMLKRTVQIYCGKVFNNPITVSDDFNDSILEWFPNIDRGGRSIHEFGRDIFQAAIVDGITHVLVDYPDVGGPITLEQKRNEEIRPYFVHIPHSSVLGWSSADGRTLDHFRFRRQAMVEGPDFSLEKLEEIVVIYRDGRYQVFRETANGPRRGDWELYTENQISIRKIPIITFYTSRRGFMVADPPLEDLAHLNLQHWQSSSDQEHILHVARVPILLAKGMSDDNKKLVISPNMFVRVEDPNADIKYVEHEGKAISAGRESIRDIEERAAILGMEFIVRRPSIQTATGRVIDSLETESVLNRWVEALQKTLQRAIELAAEYETISIENVGKIYISRDFAPTLNDSMEIEALLRSREARDLSRDQFWTELQRRGILGENFNSEKEKGILKKELAEAPQDENRPPDRPKIGTISAATTRN